MRAMMLTGIRQMELRETPAPPIASDTDVRVRMHAVGICGSDVHYFTHGRIGCSVVEFPFVVGHECAGEVETVGDKVTRVKPGDRIAIEPTISCMDCDQCRMGRFNTCLKQRFISCPGQAGGAMCEYVVIPERNCYPLQDSTTFEQAAAAEPLAIGVYAAQRVPDLRGANVGILGAGPIGRSTQEGARIGRAGAIYVTDKIGARLDAAKAAGAAWTGNPDQSDVVKDILGQQPHGLDVVFECCGQQDALDQAVDLLKPGGYLVIIGIPEVERMSFDVDNFRRREITVLNIRRQNECGKAAIDLIESGWVNVDALITHRFPLEDAQDAFEMAADYRDGVVKAIFSF